MKYPLIRDVFSEPVEIIQMFHMEQSDLSGVGGENVPHGTLGH
jgi:hypothetical protein